MDLTVFVRNEGRCYVQMRSVSRTPNITQSEYKDVLIQLCRTKVQN